MKLEQMVKTSVNVLGEVSSEILRQLKPTKEELKQDLLYIAIPMAAIGGAIIGGWYLKKNIPNWVYNSQQHVYYSKLGDGRKIIDIEDPVNRKSFTLIDMGDNNYLKATFTGCNGRLYLDTNDGYFDLKGGYHPNETQEYILPDKSQSKIDTSKIK